MTTEQPIRRKKYRSIVRAVFDKPWAIMPEKFKAIQELISLRSDGVEISPEQIEAVTAGRRRADSQATGQSVAVLQLFGVMAQRMGMLEQMSGGTSTEAFGRAFRQAVDDPSVAHIVLQIDSPGGSVFGTAELAEAIYAARGVKPITAVVDSLGASAAYHVAAAADRIAITPSGLVGSIGVLHAHIDTSGMDEKAGVKQTIIRMPDAKAEGIYGEPLSEEASEAILSRVSQYYEQFVGNVARFRGVDVSKVKLDYGQGRVLTARDALAAGMVDEIASFDEVISRIVTQRQGGKQTMSAETSNVTTTQQAPAEKPKPAIATHEQVFAAIKLAALPPDVALDLSQKLLSEGVPYDSLLARVGDEVAKVSDTHKPGPTLRIQATESELDKFRAVARDALCSRVFGHGGPAKVFDRTAKRMVDFKGQETPAHLRRLPGLAAECMRQCGYDQRTIDGLQPFEIARLITGADPSNFGLRAASDGPAYNTSGMFSNILLDASNVVARNGYDNQVVSFNRWMRQAESLPDFKEVHKTILGEIGDPKTIPEDGTFTETTTSDAKESYRLTVWGSMFSLTWQAVVNDQLGEFMRVPMKQAASMRRKQNRLAYGVLKDNPTMADTGALFNATAQTTAGGHANLTTGSATPTVATLNAMKVKMRQMKPMDATDGAALNLQPKYIVSGTSLEGTILQLLASQANPAVGGSAAGNSGVANIWQGSLEPVFDAELDAAYGGSDTAWHLATDWMQMEHVEYAYLQGLETPAMEQANAFDRLALRYRMYQAFAVHPVEYRGLQKHAGA